jgi:hypothetical protein
MWVYGDAEYQTSPALIMSRIDALLVDLPRRPAGIARHGGLVNAFILASELMQGVADADFAVRGRDGPSKAQDATMGLLVALADAVVQSWRSGCHAPNVPPELTGRQLMGAELPPRIIVRRAEGYAFYGLYPEAYTAAALASGLGPDTRVIGIRSIGCGLAAIVASALGAAPPVTVRPIGDPFRRELRTSPEFDERIRRNADAAFAIVDEGPGLSGSSFAAVADWLAECGVAKGQIHFFPGHGGEPGVKASAAVHARWAATPRHVRSMDEILLEVGDKRLEQWVADLLGPLDGPLKDISGGTWRALRCSNEANWPAADRRLERRKLLARTGGELFLVKFTGLGEDGARKFDLARQLSRAGFTPEPIGLRHGFLIERWVDADPLGAREFGRDRLAGRIGEYLAFRARCLAVPAGGASPSTLARMARHNIALAFGADLGSAVGALLEYADELDPAVNRIHTDGRLQACEWLVTRDGDILKTDALDHATSHDLVGCQDIAWDIAGAIAEFNLDERRQADLCAGVERQSGTRIDRRLLKLMLPCYLGFQTGLWSMALEGADEAERRRIEALLQGYRQALERIVR